jgi:hypothetical protein
MVPSFLVIQRLLIIQDLIKKFFYSSPGSRWPVLSIACYGGEADYESFNEVLEFSKRVPLIEKYYLNSESY